MAPLLELHIVVTNDEALRNYPFTARIAGVNATGHGSSVAGAIDDLFTTKRATQAASNFEFTCRLKS